MNTSRIHLSAAFCFLSLPLTAAEPASTVRHVELYPSGAAVTREVLVEAAGEAVTTVELKDLPSGLIDSSVQIAPVGDPGVRIGGFAFLPNENPVREDDPRTAELRAALEQVDGELRALRGEREGLQARDAYYASLTASIRKSLEEESTQAGYDLGLAAWEKYEQNRDAARARLKELDVTEKQLSIRRADAQKDLDERVGALNGRAGVLRFDLAGGTGAALRLLLRYQVREAGWAPVYEVRADPAKGTVEWIYKARIWQRTGEDWTAVAASLNSASALNAGGLPDLPPWILQRIEPRPVPYAKARAQDVAYELSSFAVAADAGAAVPESTTTGFFIHMPEKLSLESGKAPVVRQAFSGQLKGEFWSEAVPELSTEAWLMAGLTNELGWPVLAGEAYCYIDGQLVARRLIDPIAAGEEFELAVGRNEKIAIERKERVRKESEGGLIDRSKRHEFKYETTVDNRMPVAHRVVLQDRFPIGRDNKIQVKIEAPKDVKPEEGTGLFKWERTVGAGAQVVMTTQYTIIYPAEWTLNTPL